MNDKGPPRAPFGAPGERTIIRPNPGGRRPVDPSPAAGKPAVPQNPIEPSPPQPVPPATTPYVPPSTPANPNSDDWIHTREQAPQPSAQAQAPAIAIDELVAPNENPILRSAGPLLLLARSFAGRSCARFLREPDGDRGGQHQVLRERHPRRGHPPKLKPTPPSTSFARPPTTSFRISPPRTGTSGRNTAC